MTAFAPCFASVIKAEGGYCNVSRDPGGRTNLGVTQRAWEHWLGHPVTEADMRALTPNVVAPFYRAQYWNVIHGDSLPAGLALVMFHAAVNAGPRRAVILLQQALNTAADGALGPATLAAIAERVRTHTEGATIARYQDALRAFYHSLPTFPTFGKGWLARADSVEAEAQGMIR